MNRADVAAMVHALKGEGASTKEITGILGISKSYAFELLSDPDGVKVRARKESYRGRCVDCGKPTCGSDGRNKAPQRCVACHAKHRTYWTRERIITALRDWAERYGSPPTSVDWNPWLLKSDDLGMTRARFEINDCPPVSRVQGVFGSWNAALEAAGLETRRAGARGKQRGVRRAA